MEELTQDMEEEIQNYIDKFEEEFNLKVEDEMGPKILIDLFNNYVEENSSPSKKYYYILNEMGNKKTELEKTLSKEQQILFEKFYYLFQELEEQRTIQFFVYGFCMGNNLKKEVNNILNIDEKHEN